MSSSSPGSWLDRFLGLCLTFLLAAIALHWAVSLIESIWVPLVVIGVAVAGIGLAIGIGRQRSGGW